MFSTIEKLDKQKVYGTQGVCVNGNYEISPFEKHDKSPKLRTSVDLLSLKEFSLEACLGLNGH